MILGSTVAIAGGVAFIIVSVVKTLLGRPGGKRETMISGDELVMIFPCKSLVHS